MPASVKSRQLAAMSGMAGVLHSLGKQDEALGLLRRIVELRRARDAGNERALAIDLQNLATGLNAAGAFAEAEPLVAEAAASIERLHGPESLALMPVLRLQGEIDYRKGDLVQEARNVARQVALARRHLAGDHWWKAQALTEHGRVLARDGDIEGGRAAVQEAIAIYERMGSPMVIEALRRAGQVEEIDGNWSGARSWYQRTVDTCARSPEREATPTCVVASANLAEAMAHDGDGQAALPVADAAAAAVAANAGEESDAYAQALGARAVALAAVGRTAEALQVRRQRLQLLARLYGDAHPFVVSARKGVDADSAP